MSNEEMKHNRILKLQTGKRLFTRITECLKNDGVVMVGTYTRATKLTAKHIGMVKLGKSGSVYMQAGKRWDCIDGCGFRFSI